MNNNKTFHDRYIDAWNQATATGVIGPVERMLSPTYHGWFANSAASADAFTSADATTAFRQVLDVLEGATVHAENRTIRYRGEDEAVVSYELSYRTNEEFRSRALMLECWRQDAGQWQLLHDFTEADGEPAPTPGG